MIFPLHSSFESGNKNNMKTEKDNKCTQEENEDDAVIKKLDSMIEQRKNESEALKKILIGLEKISNKQKESKPNKDKSK